MSRPFLASAAALVLATTPASAQLWYNGNWNGSTTILASERDIWVPDSRVYDNFLVTGDGWNVTSLFGDYLSSLSPTKAYWEIRSGVSAGNGGTVVYSGLSDISWVVMAGGAWGYNQYRATVSGLDLTLPAGTYWLAMAPTHDALGRAFINSTAGANGVNALLDGNSFWDSQTFNKNFVPTSQQFGASADFAYGVDGAVIINPEPGTILLVGTGLGLVSLGAWRRRRAARA